MIALAAIMVCVQASVCVGPAPEAPKATDVAQAVGVAEDVGTWAASPVDYDDDGWKDWLFVRHGGRQAARLYHNEGGVFSEVAEGTFSPKDRHNCTWADVDLDGYIDAFCTIGASEGTTRKRNELWMQNEDRTFTNKSVAYGLDDDVYGRGRATTFIDVDGNRYKDLFVGNTYPRQDGNPSPNRLYINEGGTRFRPAPEYGLDTETGAKCADKADFDNDGWTDLLVCGKERLTLYRNDAGSRFEDVSGKAIVHGVWADAELANINNDGTPDLLRIRSGSLQIRFGQDGTFPAAVEFPLDEGEFLATGNLNGDDLRDIYAVQSCGGGTENLPDKVWVNEDGLHFSELSDLPQAATGCGQDVASIDYDKSGRDDFIVLNGHMWVTGPVQVITFDPQQ